MLKSVIRQLLDFRVLRGEGGDMSHHLFVEGKLRKIAKHMFCN